MSNTNSKQGFTIIELVFVIVVIGILSAIAIPRLAVTRDDAMLVKVRSQVAAIRSGIAMQKNRRLLEGNTTLPTTLDSAPINTDGKRLFNYNDGNKSNILEYPIYSKANHDGSWTKTNVTGTGKETVTTYSVQISGTSVPFKYNASNGIFDCNQTTQNCKDLTQ